MSEPLTLEDFDALADDGARNAAIARALGWRKSRDCPGRWVRQPWLPGDIQAHHHRPRPYFTGGDTDPFGNWGLLAEVVKALTEHRDHIAFTSHWGLWDVADDEDSPGPECGTPHRAACRALVAAGLVPQKEAAENG